MTAGFPSCQSPSKKLQVRDHSAISHLRAKVAALIP
jgi:hypothetical protein